MLHKIGIMSALILGLAMPAAAECLIQKDGIGGIKLGQNLKQVKQKFPKAKMERTSDAEGVAYVAITLSKDVMVIAFQDGDDDPDSPIKLHKKIDSLSTYSPACHTASGVHPGMKIKDAEAKLGKVKKIIMSEIEAREYVTFARQPKNFTFEVERGTGIYPGKGEAPNQTRRYRQTGRIEAISVSQSNGFDN
ncbi:hypothetical protein ACTHT4_07925 [Neisseria sp. P0022.S007]|uniref:hypothetical protein n=1 Tax=unclassified Neisseria TaxID=2623750 RepID=UPI001CAFB469|nr:hypothetical protein [uncultured Neisseria sp.]MBF1280031.1 hypothetical protein [Neisseria lactamica]